MTITDPDEFEREWAQLDNVLKGDDDPGLTLAEIAVRYGIRPRSARTRIEALMVEGKLIAGWARLSNGRKVRVYRPAEAV